MGSTTTNHHRAERKSDATCHTGGFGTAAALAPFVQVGANGVVVIPVAERALGNLFRKLAGLAPDARFAASPIQFHNPAGLPWCQGKGMRRSEEHTSELQSRPHLVCRLLLEKKNSNSL